jgi:hypothetical protein
MLDARRIGVPPVSGPDPIAGRMHTRRGFTGGVADDSTVDGEPGMFEPRRIWDDPDAHYDNVGGTHEPSQSGTRRLADDGRMVRRTSAASMRESRVWRRRPTLHQPLFVVSWRLVSSPPLLTARACGLPVRSRFNRFHTFRTE